MFVLKRTICFAKRDPDGSISGAALVHPYQMPLLAYQLHDLVRLLYDEGLSPHHGSVGNSLTYGMDSAKEITAALCSNYGAPGFEPKNRIHIR